jgi:uroporphyrinogen decarboxylase
MSSPFLQAFMGEKPAHTPIWLMRQAGRYLPEYRAIRQKFPDFLAFCYTPDAATEVTLQPVQRFQLDAAIIFADILTIPDALGHRVTFTEGEGPRVSPFQNASHLLRMESLLEEVEGRLAPIFQTVKLTRQSLPASKAVIGFCGGPFTLACYMMDEKPSQGIPNLLALAAEDQPTFEALLNILTRACITYLLAQIRAGANAVQVFESWAIACPPTLWGVAVHQPLLVIQQAIHAAHLTCPVILFPRGASQPHMEALAQALAGTVSGLSLSTDHPIPWAAQTLQPHTLIQGNLNPELMAEESPAAMLAAAQTILQQATTRPEFIFNLGHGLTPQSKPQHVEALAEYVHTWRA